MVGAVIDVGTSHVAREEGGSRMRRGWFVLTDPSAGVGRSTLELFGAGGWSPVQRVVGAAVTHRQSAHSSVG